MGKPKGRKIVIALASILLVIVATSMPMAVLNTQVADGPSYTVSKLDSDDHVVLNLSDAIVYRTNNSDLAIQWAIDHAGADGTVLIKSGTYVLDRSIDLPSSITLMGEGNGSSGTVLEFMNKDPNASQLSIANADDVLVKQLRLTGNGCINISAAVGTYGNVVIQDVVAYQTASHPASFSVTAMQGGVLDGVRFIRCQAIEVGTTGFMLWGDGERATGSAMAYNTWVRNVLFEDCGADHSGHYSHYNPWSVGFDLAELTNVEGIHCLRCEASYSWESGFHIEAKPQIGDVVLEWCSSNNNGQKPDNYANDDGTFGPQFGVGYLFIPRNDTPTLIHCTATGNRFGDTLQGSL
jgi:hypothetical protein